MSVSTRRALSSAKPALSMMDSSDVMASTSAAFAGPFATWSPWLTMAPGVLGFYRPCHWLASAQPHRPRRQCAPASAFAHANAFARPPHWGHGRCHADLFATGVDWLARQISHRLGHCVTRATSSSVVMPAATLRRPSSCKLSMPDLAARLNNSFESLPALMALRIGSSSTNSS